MERLIQTRKAVKRKLQALKEGVVEQQSQLEKSYEPVTRELKELSSKLYDLGGIKKENVKTEDDVQKSILSTHSSTPVKSWSPPQPTFPETITTPSFLETSTIAENVPDYDDDRGETALDASVIAQTMSQEALEDYLTQYNPLPREYIRGMIEDSSGDIYDRGKTGVVHDPILDTYKFGNATLNFVGKDLEIGDKVYKGTSGLYELIFKKVPIQYTKTDEENYHTILKQTSAHRRHHKATEQIQGSRSRKYQNIIRPLASTKTSETPRKLGKKVGKGLFMNFRNTPIEYVHWDDVNELVDRLRLLLASQTAGNNSHNNEIVSIIEELKEANVIN